MAFKRTPKNVGGMGTGRPGLPHRLKAEVSKREKSRMSPRPLARLTGWTDWDEEG